MKTPTLLIVAGAHLEAEIHDRPRAYVLRDALLAHLTQRGMPGDFGDVVVCSDLWYLGRDELRGTPTVSIGAPGVNALTAYLASRLPSVLAVEGVMVVQMELFDLPMACCWGRDADATAAAVETFEQRYAEEFIDAVAYSHGPEGL